MDVRVRCCGLGPNSYAADGSHIGGTVVKNYLESEDYRLAVEGKLTMGYLTHRGRSMDTLPGSVGNAGVARVCGRDDAGLIVGENLPTFTHYVKEFYIEDVPGHGPWLCALVHIFDEKDGFDRISVENIKRLKALIRSGIKLTCSLVVLAFWSTEGNVDECKKIKAIKSLDWTINPSFGPLARITEVIDDADDDVKVEVTKTFSEIEGDTEFIKSQPVEGEIKVKVFSDLSAFGCSDIPKTSKVDGKFTSLKAKEFSTDSSITSVDEEVEKTYSVATLRERVRFASPKFSPRMRLRRMFLEYKQLVKQLGGSEKIDPDTLKTMRSMFASDLNYLMAGVTSDIKNGKQINTILGCSSLGVVPRKAAQALQLPYRMAFMELEKTGKISPMRFEKIKAAYGEFIKAMTDEVFGSNPIPAGLEEEESIGEEEKKV